jgi:hypothetical protein
MELKVVANLRKTSSDSTMFGRANAPEYRSFLDKNRARALNEHLAA